MLKKRIIPVLLLKDGEMVKGKRFSDYRNTGAAASAIRIYSAQDADELVFIDIGKNDSSREVLISLIKMAALECTMPLTVGGGVRSLDDVSKLISAGADKVLVTTGALKDEGLLEKIINHFGAQSLIVGIDYRGEGAEARCWINSGTEETNIHPLMAAEKMVKIGVGEILLTSIDRDGMMSGYDVSLAAQVVNASNVPVIVSGGAGNFQHLEELFNLTNASAAACASLFHFGDNNPIRARSHLKNKKIPMRSLR